MPYRLAVVVGSVRAGRIGPRVAAWFVERAARRPEVEVDALDLADLHLPADLGGGHDAPLFVRSIERADAVVLVTPEYNHGYPGPLKTAIDTVGPEWAAKPVGFVSYGGISGGLRAVEQLRPVLAELHTVTVRDVVSFAGVHDRFTADGTLKDPGPAEAAAEVLLDRLAWWAEALRSARHARPYRR